MPQIPGFSFELLYMNLRPNFLSLKIKPCNCSIAILLQVFRFMHVRIIPILLLVLFSSVKLFAQSCPIISLGQNPSTAFPVCGIDTFHQSTVPACGGRQIPVPPPCFNDGNIYTDINPYWYKFTCFQAGTLGFLINPNNQGDDYDWQLFDITGHNPDDVYTDPSLFVSGNWSGTFGATGTSATATTNIQCASYPPDNITTFSRMPLLILGHNYLLLVSHFSGNNQSGYSLSFGGGSASITDPLLPLLQTAKEQCGGVGATVKLNKLMKCSSLAGNGSDFSVAPALSTVVSAAGVNCSAGFDMDSIALIFNKPLPPGNYFLVAKNGNDGNTLLDNCDRPVPVGDSIPFTVFPIVPTPFDSIIPLGCAPDILQLVFEKNINCASVDADGSDFIITGPFPVNVAGASGNCTNGLSNIINVKLSSPIVHAGIYHVQLVAGKDGNTIIDECGQQTPPSTVDVKTYDTVSAAFTYQVFLGCKIDSIAYMHDGRNGVSQWYWTFDHNLIRTIQNPVITYTSFGQKNATLIVSNGVCSDTSSQNIFLSNYFKAAFEAPQYLCPIDLAIFKNNSVGNIISWNWDFGNGFISIDSAPLPQSYPLVFKDQLISVRLIVQNTLNCFDTAYNQIKILYNCYIAVPSAFTPNGDGLNDYLYPLNAYKADNLEFRVYNRYGQMVFETKDWTHKWDGTIAGVAQGSGTYVWMLTYTNRDTGKKVFQKGTSVLIR